MTQSFPLKVTYCGICSCPPEYCKWSGDYKRCKEWLHTNLPEMFEELNLKLDCGEEETVDKKAQKRGGKAQKEKQKKTMAAANAKANQGDCFIKVTVITEGKRQKTRVSGFQQFDIKPSDAKKTLAKRLGAGCNLDKETVVLQGDCGDYLLSNIPKIWPTIDEDQIDINN